MTPTATILLQSSRALGGAFIIAAKRRAGRGIVGDSYAGALVSQYLRGGATHSAIILAEAQ
jgi:hypothetical protein